MSRTQREQEQSDTCSESDIPEPAQVIERVLGIINGKWKVLIVMHLTAKKVMRFGELRRKLPNVTQRMLTLQLREMEVDGLVDRQVFAEVPPRVEYCLTEVGRDLKSVYKAMHAWGMRHPNAQAVRTDLSVKSPRSKAPK